MGPEQIHGASGDSTGVLPIQIRMTMRQVTRRQWWLWVTGFLVIILLVIGIVSFTGPGLLSEQEDVYRTDLSVALRGLVGLVLLFAIYVLYQQILTHRIELSLEKTLDKFQNRTEQVFKMAGCDTVTELYNRRFGERRLAEEMSRSHRHVRPLAVMRFDLRGVNQIRELLGETSTDHVIQMFARNLQKTLRASDIPIRLAADQFLVLLPDSEARQVYVILNRLNRLAVHFGSDRLPLDIVAGCADYAVGEAFQSLMLRAESSLHFNREKELGKNTAQPSHVAISSNGSGAEKNTDGRLARLNPRERQVFELVVRGKSSKEIANTLGVSPRTVEAHRAHILSELDVRSVRELVIVAMRNNIPVENTGD